MAECSAALCGLSPLKELGGCARPAESWDCQQYILGKPRLKFLFFVNSYGRSLVALPTLTPQHVSKYFGQCPRAISPFQKVY